MAIAAIMAMYEGVVAPVLLGQRSEPTRLHVCLTTNVKEGIRLHALSPTRFTDNSGPGWYICTQSTLYRDAATTRPLYRQQRVASVTLALVIHARGLRAEFMQCLVCH